MATNYYGKQAGSFKTAYLQHEIVEDVKVTAGKNQVLHVGDIVKITNGVLGLVLSASASAAGSVVFPALTTDMYIVAQSDQTMEYGHVPVEMRDYRYDNKVADKATAKKVALFRIINPQDVIVTKTTFSVNE
jgi:hypothetical protein